MTAADAAALVVIPTYDEAENVRAVIAAVLGAVPAAHVLVVDDGSPDGTADVVRGIAGADARVHLVERSGKLGLGTAYVAGFRWGLQRGYPVLVEMDADGSHPADRLPALLDAVRADETVALAIGSRWVPGGSVVDWPLRRLALSRGANAYARIVLGVDVRDVTAGFRAYRAATIARMDLGSVDSKGYCFQIDMTLRVADLGGRIVEVPIRFRDRVHGTSKMSRSVVVEAVVRVTGWGLQRRFGRWRGSRLRRS
ncbi:polyprenol monophosphomannose synthase [Curtobacterium flaccumfaciens pv. oortii]|uniref:polyprenol monophosphomannose synthase n=1 Tax=Curtobacterium flaccumfaciens TaxID=2035 RepID=UPI001BDDDB39|nr:polyprenol monophosphomannose synthase [Curtobacterium flaccumfaciens]MBT1621620.1 polyprenol monophosphomannose synthase [Curtobacterium flaccumfaciens pv. oortii]